MPPGTRELPARSFTGTSACQLDHLVNNLPAGATMIASSAAAVHTQRKMGDLNDRWGARRLAMICGLLIPGVTLLWMFAGAAWHVI